MSSFLVKCANCGSFIMRDTVCPSCHYSGKEGEEAVGDEQTLIEEYARRRSRHVRNYTIYMMLMMGTGLLGLLTAGLWLLVIYRGNVAAFLLIGLLTVLTAILGGVLSVAKKLFPIPLYCPVCDNRLDEIGLTGGCCPGCNSRLK